MKTINKISIAAIAFGLAVTLFAEGSQTVNSPDVTVLFLNYTNGGNWRFVVVSFINHEQMPIRWGDMYVEEDGSLEHHAPVFNPNLPWIKAPFSLESGGSEVVAVGTPSEAQMQWRVCRDYLLVGFTNNYTVRSKWFIR